MQIRKLSKELQRASNGLYLNVEVPSFLRAIYIRVRYVLSLGVINPRMYSNLMEQTENLSA